MRPRREKELSNSQEMAQPNSAIVLNQPIGRFQAIRKVLGKCVGGVFSCFLEDKHESTAAIRAAAPLKPRENQENPSGSIPNPNSIKSKSSRRSSRGIRQPSEENREVFASQNNQRQEEAVRRAPEINESSVVVPFIASDSHRNSESQAQHPHPVSASSQEALNIVHSYPLRQGDFNRVFLENNFDSIKTPEKGKSLIVIESSLNFAQIVWRDEKPAEGSHHKLKYLCPICFRYLSQILEFACCQNYVCHFCVEELNNTVQASGAIQEAKCPFCSSNNVKARDIDQKKAVKIYTDSPMYKVHLSERKQEVEKSKGKSKSQFNVKRRLNMSSSNSHDVGSENSENKIDIYHLQDHEGRENKRMMSLGPKLEVRGIGKRTESNSVILMPIDLNQ